MTAEIIALPGAASSPVVQHPRRGRYPRCVVSLAVFAAHVSRRAEIDPELRRTAEWMDRCAYLSDEVIRLSTDDCDPALTRHYAAKAKEYAAKRDALLSFVGKRILPQDLVAWMTGKGGIPAGFESDPRGYARAWQEGRAR